MISYLIYVVDDEKTIREGVSLALQSEYEVEAFSCGEDVLEALEQRQADLILLDIGLPGISGLEVLECVRKNFPQVSVIVITAYEDVLTVVRAMKLGARDYVVKPIHIEGLEVTIRNAFEMIRLRKEVQALQEKYLYENLPCFIGDSNAIQGVMDFVAKVAVSRDTPVLIVGGTGTGKEFVASAIHYRSPNFRGPMVTVNCSAIPNELIESELFGYDSGAFSGARATGKKGLIEGAENGTLFLDEVGDLSGSAQAKLLRFLENGEYYRVGGTSKNVIHTRVVSATNRDLKAMMLAGQFRQDLYYRLAVVKIDVPCLNKRPEDIMPLAKHFLVQFSQKHGKPIKGFSKEAENALMSYLWEGNVRQLRNVVERAVLLCDSTGVALDDLGLERTPGEDVEAGCATDAMFQDIPQSGIDFPSLEQRFERHYIGQALEMAGGNESKAAQLLNLNHHTFRYRKKKIFES